MSVFRKNDINSMTLHEYIKTFISLMDDSCSIGDIPQQSTLEKYMHAFKRVCNERIEYSKNTVVYNTNKVGSNELTVESKRKSHNYDSHQMCFLIYLLVKAGYDITIQHTYKSSRKTDQVVRVKSIYKDDKQKFSDVMFDSNEYDYDGDLKRRRRNIDAITNNIMLSLLEQEDASFSTKKCKEFKTITFNATEGKRRLKWLEHEGKTYTKVDIDYIGKEVYKFIIKNIEKHDYRFIKSDLNFINSGYIQNMLDSSSN